MNSKKSNWFFTFSVVMLLITAFAKLYSSIGHVRVLHAQDQLLHLGYRPLLISAALVELGVAAFLVTSRSDLKRCFVLFWLSANFLFYHWGNYLIGVHLCPCLGHLSDRLPLPPGLADVILKVLVLYWFLTSLNMLWRLWGATQWARLIPGISRIWSSGSPRTG